MAERDGESPINDVRQKSVPEITMTKHQITNKFLMNKYEIPNK